MKESRRNPRVKNLKSDVKLKSFTFVTDPDKKHKIVDSRFDDMYEVVKTSDGLYVIIDVLLEKIRNIIYYSDELEAPDITFESFANYNRSFCRHYLKNPVDLVIYKGRDQIYISERSHINNDRLSILRELTDDEKDDIRAISQYLDDCFTYRLQCYWSRYRDQVFAYGYWVNR